MTRQTRSWAVSMPRLILALMTAGLMALPLVGAAQTTPTAAEQQRRDAAVARWNSMTPEEQAAAKEKARAKWDAKTPEEQAAAKKRFAERHPAAAARRAEAPPPPASAAPAR